MTAFTSAQDVLEDTCALAQNRQHIRRSGLTAPTSALQAWNPAEIQRCGTYVDKWSRLPPSARCAWDQLIVHLGDNPSSGWTTWSAKSGAIPTIRKSSGILAWPAGGRHLTQKELYLAMGYPCYSLLAQTAKVPLYSLDLQCYGQHRRALGNSMHVASIGVFAACFLASVRPRAGELQEPAFA